jgi:hypothetical protein
MIRTREPVKVNRLPLTEVDLCRWLGQAAPGDWLTYHRGFLALDCDRTTGRLVERERAELLCVARRALSAAQAGQAHLVQHRNGHDDFSYVLVARPRSRAVSGKIAMVLAADTV